MKYLFLLVFILFNGLLLHAQKHVQLDSSKVEERAFNQDDLQNFKSDRDFQYMQLREPVKSLWERFWQWVWWKVDELMSTKRGRTTAWSILIVLGSAAIIFFVVKVMGIKDKGLFARGSGDGLPYNTYTEDINHISFDEAIRDAIENKNFRLATRLLYLQSLKRLSDRGYIDWQINKTNSDYIAEVAGKAWQVLFKKLTYQFEYTWYGEKNISGEEFQSLQGQFQQFNNQL